MKHGHSGHEATDDFKEISSQRTESFRPLLLDYTLGETKVQFETIENKIKPTASYRDLFLPLDLIITSTVLCTSLGYALYFILCFSSLGSFFKLMSLSRYDQMPDLSCKSEVGCIIFVY